MGCRMATRTSDFKCYGSCKLMSQMVCRVYAHQLQVRISFGSPGPGGAAEDAPGNLLSPAALPCIRSLLAD